jgi:parvulin-like peptidyl-prolyl isomerase
METLSFNPGAERHTTADVGAKGSQRLRSAERYNRVIMKFCGICVLLSLSASLYAADIALVEEIIAKVNGDIVTRSEVERGKRQIEADLKQRGVKVPELEKQLAEREKNVLSERIDQLLLVQKGREMSINVDPEVSKYIAQLQLESKIADQEKFQAYVREQSGQPYEDFRNEIRNGILTRRVINQEVGGRINVPKADVRKYYDEHKSEFIRQEQVFLREILVSTDGKDAKGIAAAEVKAKALSARGKKGEKFGELARDNSDAATGKQMGELGAFKRGELDKKIEEIVFKEDRGFVTDPIRVANGFLILKVEERFKEGQAPFEEVENEVMEKLYMPRMQPAVREYLTKLRQEAFLEIKPGYVDSEAAPGKNTAWTDPAQLKPETTTKEEVANRKRKKRVLGVVPIPGTTKK